MSDNARDAHYKLSLNIFNAHYNVCYLENSSSFPLPSKLREVLEF